MSDLLSTVLAAGVGASAALALQFVKAKQDRGARFESEVRTERHGVYRRIVAILLKGDEAAEGSVKQLATDVALFASDDVARAWIAFLDATLDRRVKSDSPEALQLWSQMLLAIRRDSSRPHTTLSESDVLALLGIRRGRDPELARIAAIESGLAKPKSDPSDEGSG
ncbi:MAG: hypothetical protein WDO74_22235 [Pseudomonadota bacterium]